MSPQFTAVILSAEPHTRKLPANIAVVNHVSTFRSGSNEETAADLHAARLASIAKAKTPYCFLLDNDDDYGYMEVATESIVRGPDINYNTTTDTTEHLQVHPWVLETYLNNPMLMHNSVVCNTEALQAVCRKLPQGPYLSEVMMYSILGAWKGVEFDARVRYVWNIHPTGMHNTVTNQIHMLSRRWIVKNIARVLAELKREYP